MKSLFPVIFVVCSLNILLQNQSVEAYDLTKFNSLIRKLTDSGEYRTQLFQPSCPGAKKFSIPRRFPCPLLPPSTEVPSSVHQLRPADIKVIAAMGDSLTAGRGSGGSTILALLSDYRGYSWCAGGDDSYQEFSSIPNILREYNPNLYGYSTGKGDECEKFNVATSGDRSDSALAQASRLIAKMRADPNVDFDNDWKLVTVFFGGNDICEACQYNITPEVYIGNMKDALDLLQASLPRTFVNLVEILDVDLLRTLPEGAVCKAAHKIICQCVTYPDSEEQYEMMRQYRMGYQRLTEELVSSGIYDTNDNFTVVLQPFYKDTALPVCNSKGGADYSFFAADCLHYSKKGQMVAAMGLWNNMMEPVGSKSFNITWGNRFEPVCPTEESPYLYTRLNSAPNKVPQSEHSEDSDTKPDSDSRKSTENEPEEWIYNNVHVVVSVFFGVFILTSMTLWVLISRKRNPKQTPGYEMF